VLLPEESGNESERWSSLEKGGWYRYTILNTLWFIHVLSWFLLTCTLFSLSPCYIPFVAKVKPVAIKLEAKVRCDFMMSCLNSCRSQ
jgi:hypothetical protein